MSNKESELQLLNETARSLINPERLDEILRKFAPDESGGGAGDAFLNAIIGVATQIQSKSISDEMPPKETIAALFDDKKYRPGAMIVLYDQRGHVLMVESPKSVSDDQRNYNFPQGGINKGESLLEAAYWELWEEMGIDPERVELIEYSGCEDIDFKPGRDHRGWKKGKRYYKVKFRLKEKSYAFQCAPDPEEVAQFIFVDPGHEESMSLVLGNMREAKASAVRALIGKTA